MEQELINGKTIDEIDDLIAEYEFQFGEKPICIYPQSIYDQKYVSLIEMALKRNRPYTEDELYVDGNEEDIWYQTLFRSS